MHVLAQYGMGADNHTFSLGYMNWLYPISSCEKNNQTRVTTREFPYYYREDELC